MRCSLLRMAFAVFLIATSVVALTPIHCQAGEFKVLAANNPPFNYRDTNGKPRGIAVDVLKIIMARVGKPVSDNDMEFIPWPRAVQDTTGKPAHILLSPARTHRRENKFQWVGPLHDFKLGLFARKSRNITIRKPSDLHTYRIGVIRSSAPAQILERKYGINPTSLINLGTDVQLFRMLDRNRVDLIPRGQMSAMFWMKRLGLNPSNYTMVHVINELELYIGFSPSTDKTLIQRLNRELELLKKSGRLEAIVRRNLNIQ